MALPVLFLTLLAASSPGQGPAEDLASLTSDDAGTRELATRRLCGRLPAEHHRALFELAVGADHELERRIPRVLAARDERLSLAVELVASTDSKARAIGRAAFFELLARWRPSFDDAPLPSYRARDLIRGSQQGLIRIPRCRGDCVPLLERLAEDAAFGLPVVLDPGIDARFEGDWGPFAGTPLDQLERICLNNGLTYELRGPTSERSVVHGLLGHWLRVCAGRDATGVPTREVLLSWALEVAQGGESAPAAARALATTGWPAPLAWFSQRWRAEEDAAALSGLLAAAARGRVALLLTEPGTHVTMRDRLDRLAAAAPQGEDSWEIERIARGMAQAGARSSGGEDPSEVWSAAAEKAPSLARWARLLVLEGHHRGDRAVTRAVLEGGGGGDPALWRRALRAFVSDSDRAPLEFSFVGLAPALEVGHADGLGRLLHSAGVRSEDLREVLGSGLLRAELSLRVGNEPECALALYEAWRLLAGSDDEVEALLAGWCAEFGRSRVAQAVVGVELEEELRPAWERLLELSGVVAPSATVDPGEDLQRLACRAGQRDGAEVRGVLLEELSDLDSTDPGRVGEFIEAWRRVGWALQEADEEAELQSFAAQTRLLVQDYEVLLEMLEGFPPSPRALPEALDVGLQSLVELAE